MSDAPTLLAGVPVTTPDASDMRLAMLIWSDAGVGKTTLAATAPGNKLFVMFDPDGALSLSDRADVRVLDLSDRNHVMVMGEFRKDDPFQLTRYLTANPDIETVVIDSVTTLAYAALREAVGHAQNKNSTMESPGINGYAWRNATVLRACTSVMTVTKRLGRNVIFLTHEAAPDRDTEGRIVSITMALSEGTANQVGLRLNEVWWMQDTNGVREISVRPCKQRKPMKSRLFLTEGNKTTFTWHYNPETLIGEGIADWFHMWQANAGKKIPLPAAPVVTKSKGGMKK
jgi:hypothetical protein